VAVIWRVDLHVSKHCIEHACVVSKHRNEYACVVASEHRTASIARGHGIRDCARWSSGECLRVSEHRTQGACVGACVGAHPSIALCVAIIRRVEIRHVSGHCNRIFEPNAFLVATADRTLTSQFDSGSNGDVNKIHGQPASGLRSGHCRMQRASKLGASQ
jgi:hypothetical protein